MQTATLTQSTSTPQVYALINPNVSGTGECLIMLGLARYTYPGPGAFTLLPPGQFAWLGVLLDPNNLDAENQATFVAFLSANNDSIFERDLTMSRLQNLAYEFGFTQSEVQVRNVLDVPGSEEN